MAEDTNLQDKKQDELQSQPVKAPGTGSYNQYIDPDYHKKQHKRKLLIIFISTVIAMAVIGLAVIVAMSLQSSSTPPPGNGPNANGGNSANLTVACEDEVCFEEKFSLCQPAKYNGHGPEENSAAEYVIPGVQNVGCLVSLTYVSSDDEEIIGKEMTCDFDNEINFRQSLALVSEYLEDHDCKGSLIDFYNSLGDKARLFYGI